MSSPMPAERLRAAVMDETARGAHEPIPRPPHSVAQIVVLERPQPEPLVEAADLLQRAAAYGQAEAHEHVAVRVLARPGAAKSSAKRSSVSRVV